MKMKELPKAPIQIQRDELLAKVTELKEELTKKNNLIATLESELNLKTQAITQKDNIINNFQIELNLKNQAINEKQNIITNLEATLVLNNEAIIQKNHDVEELKHKLFALENDVVLLGNNNVDEFFND